MVHYFYYKSFPGNTTTPSDTMPWHSWKEWWMQIPVGRKNASFLFSGLARFSQKQNIWFLPFSRTATLWNLCSLQLRFQEKGPDNAFLCAILFLVRFAKGGGYGTANQIKTKTVMRWNTHTQSTHHKSKNRESLPLSWIPPRSSQVTMYLTWHTNVPTTKYSLTIHCTLAAE